LRIAAGSLRDNAGEPGRREGSMRNNETMNDRVPFREGIGLQPQSLQAGLKAVPEQLAALDLEPLATGTVALVGIGASLYAAVVGAAHMRHSGLRAYALAATELYDPAVDPADAYIALSASGRSVEPARAMELHPRAATFGIARTAKTPLGAVVRNAIATESGSESSPNTTSFMGSLLALGLMAERVGRIRSGTDWQRLPDLAAGVLQSCQSAVRRAASLLAGRIAVDCVGTGVAFGISGYAALLLREAVRVAAQPWDTLNFLHGPMEPNDRRSGVLLFGSGREVTLAQDLAGFGIPAVLVTDRTDIGETGNLVVISVPSLSPGLGDAILRALPAQLLVADLMETAGLPQCVFRYRQTDTKLPERPAS
jgi:glucosamine--fructose-6-phosphate aminotransferase (isomerizing)